MLNHYKDILLAKREELAEKLSHRDGIAVERSPDALDDVQRSAEREFMIIVLDRNRKMIKDVDLALERMEDGEYGICMRCEEQISPKRLNAVPWASYCVTCQERVDQQRAAEERLDYSFSDAA